MPTSNNNEVTLKEIRETYYSLRNCEIEHLWQRSIFLSALLVLFYSGYGYLVSKFLDEEVKKPLLLHELCCAIALFAVVFSIIWIMMAKGSKAWLEVYEKKIIELERNMVLKIDMKYQLGEYCTPWNLDHNLYTTKPGSYSLSKLNILIGIILNVTWLIIFIIHFLGAFTSLKETTIDQCIHKIVLIILLLAIIFILITASCNSWAKCISLTLENQHSK